MNTYTAFCQQANGRGTIWIEKVEAATTEEAIEVARQSCADAWEYDDVEDVHCLGLATGDIQIVHWEDQCED